MNSFLTKFEGWVGGEHLVFEVMFCSHHTTASEKQISSSQYKNYANLKSIIDGRLLFKNVGKYVFIKVLESGVSIILQINTK